jgi:serine/threonine protein kinase
VSVLRNSTDKNAARDAARYEKEAARRSEIEARVTRGTQPDYGILRIGATRAVAASGVHMTLRSESARHVIRVNGTSIDVTSSNAITFGYVNDLARAGRVIAGRYRLRAQLRGRKLGGMQSSLWRGESVGLGQAVLVELLDPAIAEESELCDLFLVEASAAAAVVSPFVQRLLDFGIEASTPYLVSEIGATQRAGDTPTIDELGMGCTLADRLALGWRPSRSELARMVNHVGQALDALHAAEVLHRDLTSERIQLSLASAPELPAGEVAKLSFGISKLMNDTLELVRTMARRAISPPPTPYYASPEQVLGDVALCPQSDIWSLAVIVFECVTGELPFAGANIADRLVQICTGAPRLPSELCRVPRGFDAWFARGVHKSPSERWPSAGVMAGALADILDTRRGASTPDSQ